MRAYTDVGYDLRPNSSIANEQFFFAASFEDDSAAHQASGASGGSLGPGGYDGAASGADVSQSPPVEEDEDRIPEELLLKYTQADEDLILPEEQKSESEKNKKKIEVEEQIPVVIKEQEASSSSTKNFNKR